MFYLSILKTNWKAELQDELLDGETQAWKSKRLAQVHAESQ